MAISFTLGALLAAAQAARLVDAWTYPHALTGLVAAWAYFKASQYLSISLGWEAFEATAGATWGLGDPSLANTLTDVLFGLVGFTVGARYLPAERARDALRDFEVRMRRLLLR